VADESASPNDMGASDDVIVPSSQNPSIETPLPFYRRDHYLWFKEHEEACSPQACGYPTDSTG
jgi:hypothetical protein